MIWSKQISGTKKMGHTTQTSATKTWIQNSILTESWQRCQTGDVNISTNRSPHRSQARNYRLQVSGTHWECWTVSDAITYHRWIWFSDPTTVCVINRSRVCGFYPHRRNFARSLHKMAAVNVFQLEISWRCLTIWTLRAFTFNIVKEDTKRKKIKK